MSQDQQPDPSQTGADATEMTVTASADELQQALADPELADQVRDVVRHLGSAPFDPVGTPED